MLEETNWILSVVAEHHPDLPQVVFTNDDDYYGEVSDDGSTMVFTDAFLELDKIRKLYVVLRELSHLIAGLGHRDDFYECLEGLVIHHGIPPATCREIEQIYPRSWEVESWDQLKTSAKLANNVRFQGDPSDFLGEGIDFQVRGLDELEFRVEDLEPFEAYLFRDFDTGREYAIYLEGWYDDCMESRGLGNTDFDSVEENYLWIAQEELGPKWAAPPAHGYDPHHPEAEYGVTWIVRELPGTLSARKIAKPKKRKRKKQRNRVSPAVRAMPWLAWWFHDHFGEDNTTEAPVEARLQIEGYGEFERSRWNAETSSGRRGHRLGERTHLRGDVALPGMAGLSGNQWSGGYSKNAAGGYMDDARLQEINAAFAEAVVPDPSAINEALRSYYSETDLYVAAASLLLGLLQGSFLYEQAPTAYTATQEVLAREGIRLLSPGKSGGALLRRAQLGEATVDEIAYFLRENSSGTTTAARGGPAAEWFDWNVPEPNAADWGEFTDVVQEDYDTARRQVYKRQHQFRFDQQRRDAEGKWPLNATERQQIVDAYEGLCYWCRRPEDEVGTFAIDHYLPIAQGGNNLPENLVPACRYCNSKHGDKDPEIFRAWIDQQIQRGDPYWDVAAQERGLATSA